MTHTNSADAATESAPEQGSEPGPAVRQCLGASVDGIEVDCGQVVAHPPHPIADPELAPILATRQPGRASKIAAIHAYAQWLADNPDVPIPTQVDGNVHQHGVERAASIEVVRAFITSHDAAKYTSGDTGWAIATVMREPVHITHTVFTNDNKRDADPWL